MLKSSGLIPDGRVVLAGQGPLLWLYGAQVLRAGGQIAAICETTPRASYLAAAPYLPAFLLSPYWIKGLALIREVMRSVQVISGVTRLEAHGTAKVEKLSWEAGSRKGEMAADLVMLHQGVVPHVNLAMAAGVRHRWDEPQACFVPMLDESGHSSVDGIMVAGDGGGIGGAESATERGRLAAIACIEALEPGNLSRAPSKDNVLNALAKAMRGRAFLNRLYRPARQFRVPMDDATIVCRCEEVTAGDIRASVMIGATGPNQLKAYHRTGMGPCQGRLCGLTVTELLADARGKSPDDIGYYRLRSPVKPISLAELASIPADEAAVKAVVRG